jgi:hypothetical protein
MKWSQLTQSSSSLTAQSDKALRLFEILRSLAGSVVAFRQKQGDHAAQLRPNYTNALLTATVIGYRIPPATRKKVGIFRTA